MLNSSNLFLDVGLGGRGDTAGVEPRALCVAGKPAAPHWPHFLPCSDSLPTRSPPPPLLHSASCYGRKVPAGGSSCLSLLAMACAAMQLSLNSFCWAPGLTPVIPATQEAEIKRIPVQSQPGWTVSETISQKTNTRETGQVGWLSW
jgi:hypothetical protein